MIYNILGGVLPAVATSLLISFTSIPVIIRIANLKKLMDEPDSERKLHEQVIPTLGGIAIFSSFIISYSIWGKAGTVDSYPYFVAALFMLFLIGIKDDILVISPSKKFMIQFLAAAEIVLGGKLGITNFGDLLGIHEVPYWIGAPITIVTIVGIINSFNLIDGIDGLAGGIGVIITGVYGAWFWGAGFYSMAILSFVLTGSLLGFLVYNIHPAKIFMGDTGSMAVGFILSYLTLQFIHLNYTLPYSSEFYFPHACIIAIAILIIPIVDTIRVILIRTVKGMNPFQADYNHTHHVLIRMGISHHVASFALWMTNLLIIGAAFLLSELNGNALLFITMGLGFIILPVLKVIFNILGLGNNHIIAENFSFSVDNKGKLILKKEGRNSSFNRSGIKSQKESGEEQEIEVG